METINLQAKDFGKEMIHMSERYDVLVAQIARLRDGFVERENEVDQEHQELLDILDGEAPAAAP